ncbi:MAG TPA: EthD family reductase [Longimicrobiales bacterium]|nr:EthD family reductase [Longimicrobiales bacterium]
MIRVSVLYGNGPEARFDHEYYHSAHRELVESRLRPLGLVRIEMDRGVAGGGGTDAPYVASAHLYFESLDAFQEAFAAHGEELLADIPNYTNVTPVLQVSEIVHG